MIDASRGGLFERVGAKDRIYPIGREQRNRATLVLDPRKCPPALQL